MEEVRVHIHDALRSQRARRSPTTVFCSVCRAIEQRPRLGNDNESICRDPNEPSWLAVTEINFSARFPEPPAAVFVRLPLRPLRQRAPSKSHIHLPLNCLSSILLCQHERATPDERPQRPVPNPRQPLPPSIQAASVPPHRLSTGRPTCAFSSRSGTKVHTFVTKNADSR